MEPFPEATYSELKRLLAIVEKPLSYKRIDYDWFLSWADGDAHTLTHQSTSKVISNFERE